MKTGIFILSIALTVMGSVQVSAKTIVEQLRNRQNVTISQPEALSSRLSRPVVEQVVTDEASQASVAAPTPVSTTSAGGYRIQVFSDNNPRTAKREAQSKAEAISAAFPQWGTYITFDSPYWRLRVGDFRSYEDATHAVIDLKNAFPAWRRELRVVRDRIKVPAE